MQTGFEVPEGFVAPRPPLGFTLPDRPNSGYADQVEEMLSDHRVRCAEQMHAVGRDRYIYRPRLSEQERREVATSPLSSRRLALLYDISQRHVLRLRSDPRYNNPNE